MPLADVGDDVRTERPGRQAKPPMPGWTAYVANAGAIPVDSEKGRAFLSLPGPKRIVLGVGDPATHELNMKEIWAGWGARWRDAGTPLLKWWRVENSREDHPPAGDVLWPAIANPEVDAEYARMRTILEVDAVVGVFGLGKAPGFPAGLLRSDHAVFLECFRQSADGDHNVPNSMRWWRDQGVAHPIPVCQDPSWGMPFGTLPQQVAQARAAGAHGVGLYLLENCPADQLRACAAEWSR